MPVRTVLGDIEADGLGRVDYHEHLFQISPLLLGDELDNEDASRFEAAELVSSGFEAMIDATPIGLGRNPRALVRISAATGLHVIATTGVHREAHYGTSHWLLDASDSDLARLFINEIVVGLPDIDGPTTRAADPDCDRIRAGILKVGIDYWSISQFQRRALGAVAEAHRATGAPVMVHLEHGSAAVEVVALLADLGVAADAIVLAHIDRAPDPGLHAEVASTGAYLGYDGFARTKTWPDSALIDCLLAVADLGFTDRLLIGGDVARRTRYRGYGGMPGLAYLGERVLPRLAAAGRNDVVQAALIDNPARLLSRVYPQEEM